MEIPNDGPAKAIPVYVMISEGTMRNLHSTVSNYASHMKEQNEGISWAGFWLAVGMVVSAAIMKGLIT